MPKTKLEEDVRIENTPFTLTEDSDNTLYLSQYVGEGSCTLGKFTLSAILPSYSLRLQFENGRSFHIGLKDFIEGCLAYAEANPR